MLAQSQSEARRQQFVAALRANGAIQTTPVANAFLAVPRERFIEAFYERDGRDWKRRERRTAEADQWLDAIYQDQALTTALNAHQLPTSSSSQPSLMAHMLEALEVQPGQSALEIGTGTGYNAALLAHLAQNPAQVTSVEVERKIAARAAAILHEVAGPVKIWAGDGRSGVPTRAPYERIIATASSDHLPRAWFAQLAPGGRLVMPLEGSLQMSGFLVIEKGDNSTGRGSFRPIPLHFMALHEEAEEILPYPTLPAFAQIPVTATVQAAAGDPLLAALHDHAFRWFAQWAWPAEGSLRLNPMQAPDGKGAWRIAHLSPSTLSSLHLNKQPDGSWSGNQRGPFPLWTTLQSLYQRYLDLAQPAPEAFQVAIEDGRASLLVSSDGNGTCLRDLFD